MSTAHASKSPHRSLPSTALVHDTCLTTALYDTCPLYMHASKRQPSTPKHSAFMYDTCPMNNFLGVTPINMPSSGRLSTRQGDEHARSGGARQGTARHSMACHSTAEAHTCCYVMSMATAQHSTSTTPVNSRKDMRPAECATICNNRQQLSAKCGSCHLRGSTARRETSTPSEDNCTLHGISTLVTHTQGPHKTKQDVENF